VDVGREANECFDAALADGTGAEVVVQSASVEGEPIFDHHRALPEGGVEVFVDYRRRIRGSQPELVPLPGPGDVPGGAGPVRVPRALTYR
jgi:hypothetical protein